MHQSRKDGPVSPPACIPASPPVVFPLGLLRKLTLRQGNDEGGSSGRQSLEALRVWRRGREVLYQDSSHCGQRGLTWCPPGGSAGHLRLSPPGGWYTNGKVIAGGLLLTLPGTVVNNLTREYLFTSWRPPALECKLRPLLSLPLAQPYRPPRDGGLSEMMPHPLGLEAGE